MHVVIVGNGVAGFEAALAVRAAEPGWAVTLVSEESDHFFSRTALLYALAGQLAYRDLEPYERDAYARSGFTRVRARAVRLDPAAHTLHLQDGRAISYDRLLLATGSRPRPAPWSGGDLGGVGHFVTMQDLEWLEAEVHPHRPGVDRPPNPDAHAPPADSPYRRRPASGAPARRPVVIGGGLIGVEVVEALLAARLRPVFVVREEWFWPVSLDRREALWISEELRAHGVDVRLGGSVEAIEGDGRVTGVRLGDGLVPADLVVVAIGVVPNTAWLGDAVQRDAGGGIVVDERLRTSAPDVFAAGDCASVPWSDGSVRPELLWYTARDQGRVAAQGLLGRDATYRRGTWYNSAKLMDIEYTTVGRLSGPTEWFYEERGRVRSTTRIVHSEGVVQGFTFLGRRWDHSICARWIEEGRRLSWVLAHLNEARFDTEFVPPLVVPAGEVA